MLNGPVTLEGARLLPMRVEPSVAGVFVHAQRGQKSDRSGGCAAAEPLRVVDLLRVSVGKLRAGRPAGGNVAADDHRRAHGLRELRARGGGVEEVEDARRRQGGGRRGFESFFS